MIISYMISLCNTSLYNADRNILAQPTARCTPWAATLKATSTAKTYMQTTPRNTTRANTQTTTPTKTNVDAEAYAYLFVPAKHQDRRWHYDFVQLHTQLYAHVSAALHLRTQMCRSWCWHAGLQISGSAHVRIQIRKRSNICQCDNWFKLISGVARGRLYWQTSLTWLQFKLIWEHAVNYARRRCARSIYVLGLFA